MSRTRSWTRTRLVEDSVLDSDSDVWDSDLDSDSDWVDSTTILIIKSLQLGLSSGFLVFYQFDPPHKMWE